MILIQEAQAGVKGCSAPALYCIIADFVHLVDGNGDVCQLFRIADGFSDACQNFTVVDQQADIDI